MPLRDGRLTADHTPGFSSNINLVEFYGGRCYKTRRFVERPRHLFCVRRQISLPPTYGRLEDCDAVIATTSTLARAANSRTWTLEHG
jgi:hypothetical protein